MGNLAFNPSSTTPDFEFTITNFSKLLGANPTNGVVVSFVDGEVNVDTSKDAFGGLYTVNEPQVIPEPSTVLVWAGLAGGMAWGVRRRSRRSPLDRNIRLALVNGMNASLRKTTDPP